VTVADTTGGELPATTGDVGAMRAEAAALAPLLELGVPEPVTSPFMMPAPYCTRLAYTSLMYGMKNDDSPFARFGLHFNLMSQPEATSPLLARTAPAVSVTADTGARPQDKPGTINAEVDGHPATLGIDRLVVYDVNGLALEITTELTDLTPRTVFHQIHVYEDVEESSGWGTPIAS
jgi:hypothetical protein